jgi:hypothetical protein
MNLEYFNQQFVIREEHKEALRLLTALNEGDDSVMPAVHAFLKRVKDRQEAEAVARSAAEVKREKRKTAGRKNSDKFEVATRVEGGVDYGATGLVLARRGNLRLVWRSGAKFWADQLTGSTYTPGELVIMEMPEGARRPRTYQLTDNHRKPGTPDTRLSKKLLERYADRIDERFGAGAAVQIASLTQTVVF